MPYSLMFLLSCGGGCDENPRCFFKNEGFILQVPRTLLGDRPQLSAPFRVTRAEESWLIQVMFPFWGILQPVTAQHRGLKVQPSHPNSERHSRLVMGATEVFVRTESLLSFSLHPLFCTGVDFGNTP